MRSIILSAFVFAAAAVPASACNWSKTSTVAQTKVPTISTPLPVRVAALRDVWLERMVG